VEIEEGRGIRFLTKDNKENKAEEKDVMKSSDLIFVGIGGSVVALNRRTGERVWATHLKGRNFVNVLMEDGKILATCGGEIFCLDPITGAGVWHNPLKGLGTGLATIATTSGSSGVSSAAPAEQQLRDEQAESAGAAAAVF
jgi:outer membrane protein assembly factor BamB